MFNLILLAAFSPEFLSQKLYQPEYLHTFLLSYICLFLRYKVGAYLVGTVLGCEPIAYRECTCVYM